MRKIKINFKPLLITATILAIFTALFSLMYFTNATAEENAQSNSEEAQTNDTIHVRAYTQNGIEFVQEIDGKKTKASMYEYDFADTNTIAMYIDEFAENNYDVVNVYNGRSVIHKLYFGKTYGFEDSGYRPWYIEKIDIDKNNVDFKIYVSPSYLVNFDAGEGQFSDEQKTKSYYQIEGQKFYLFDYYSITPPENKVFKGWFTREGTQVFNSTEVPAGDTWDHNLTAVYSDDSSTPVYNFKTSSVDQKLHIVLTKLDLDGPTPPPYPDLITIFDGLTDDYTIHSDYLTDKKLEDTVITYGANGNYITVSWYTYPLGPSTKGTKYVCTVYPPDTDTRFEKCTLNGSQLDLDTYTYPESDYDFYFDVTLKHIEPTTLTVQTQNRAILLCTETTETRDYNSTEIKYYPTSQITVDLDKHDFVKYNYGIIDERDFLTAINDENPILPFTLKITTYDDDFLEVNHTKTFTFSSFESPARDNKIISASLGGNNIDPFYGYKEFLNFNEDFVIDVKSDMEVTYDVKFDATDGMFEDGSKEVTIQQKVAEKFVMPDPDPIYPEYKLLGYVDENDELYTRDSFVPDPLDSSIATFDTLYASWEFNPTPPEPTPTPEEPEVVNAQTSDSTNAIIALVVLAIIGASITIASRKIYNK